MRLDAVKTQATDAYQYFVDNAPLYAQSLGEVIKKTTKMALPMIAMYAISNTPGAEAGPVAWGMCVSACQYGLVVALPGGVGLISLATGGGATCQVLCSPWMVAPGVP